MRLLKSLFRKKFPGSRPLPGAGPAWEACAPGRVTGECGRQVVWGPHLVSISRCVFAFVSVASTLTGISSLRTTGSREGSFPLSALREAQNLALTGLNMIARDEGSCDRDPAEGGQRAFPLCRFPGAVHLLPLVRLFISLHCRALQESSASGAKRSGAPGDSPARSSCVSSRVEASAEDSLCHLEHLCVASLSVLQHLVCHSGAVVSLILSGAEADSAAGEDNPSLARPGAGTSDPGGLADHQGQHPLLKMLLRLLTLSSAAPGHLQANVLSQCLQVLVRSAENSPFDLLPRYDAARESRFFVVLPDLLRLTLWPFYLAHILAYLYCSALSLGLGSKALFREFWSDGK